MATTHEGAWLVSHQHSMPRLVKVREILTCIVLTLVALLLVVWTVALIALGSALSDVGSEPAEPAQIEDPYFPPGTGGDVPE